MICKKHTSRRRNKPFPNKNSFRSLSSCSQVEQRSPQNKVEQPKPSHITSPGQQHERYLSRRASTQPLLCRGCPQDLRHRDKWTPLLLRCASSRHVLHLRGIFLVQTSPCLLLHTLWWWTKTYRGLLLVGRTRKARWQCQNTSTWAQCSYFSCSSGRTKLLFLRNIHIYATYVTC